MKKRQKKEVKGQIKRRKKEQKRARKALRGHEQEIIGSFMSRMSDLQVIGLIVCAVAFLFVSFGRAWAFFYPATKDSLTPAQFGWALAAVFACVAAILGKCWLFRRSFGAAQLQSMRQRGEFDWTVEDARLRSRLQAIQEALILEKSAAAGAVSVKAAPAGIASSEGASSSRARSVRRL